MKMPKFLDRPRQKAIQLVLQYFMQLQYCNWEDFFPVYDD